MANKSSRKLQDAYIMSSFKSTMLLASAVLVDRFDFSPEMLDQFFEDCATLLDSMGEGTDKWGTVNDNLAEYAGFEIIQTGRRYERKEVEQNRKGKRVYYHNYRGAKSMDELLADFKKKMGVDDGR
jgi:hypothetical protein